MTTFQPGFFKSVHMNIYTIRTGIIPANWSTAIVTPVSKSSIPHDLSDFRPKSITPIPSRLTERILVRNWLIPAFKPIKLYDQYALKPTGSTNCALISCINSVIQMLEEKNYVGCLMIDFAKAFDSVDHAIVIIHSLAWEELDHILSC